MGPVDQRTPSEKSASRFIGVGVAGATLDARKPSPVSKNFTCAVSLESRMLPTF